MQHSPRPPDLSDPVRPGLTLPAVAEPPHGHPSANQAMDILMPGSPARSEELRHQGQVRSTTNTNQFTYLEVEGASGIQWIAVPRQEIRIGSIIHYGDGRVMTNFYSKLIQRNFLRITFIKELTVEAEH